MFLFERDRLKQPAPNAFTRERPIRFQDVDAAGIIFYARALELCHDVYVEFLSEHGFPLHATLAREPWISPIRHAEADYFRPLRFGERVHVAVVAAHVGPAQPPTEVSLGFRISRVGESEAAVIAQTVHTFVERASFRRTAIPEGLERVFRAVGAPG